MLLHVLDYWLTSGTKFPMSYGQMARIQTNLGWCYCSCIKSITWVWWYLPKSQHSVSGQEELGIQDQPELCKIYLRTKPRTVLQWYQEVGFGWGFVSVEVRQAICRGRWLWDRKKGCGRRNSGRIPVFTCPFPAHCEEDEVQGYRILKI